MANLLCILILIVGGLNWASIGFLQYDFIAGFFGTQASIFSRIIYICVGLATFYFIFMMFKYRGSVNTKYSSLAPVLLSSDRHANLTILVLRPVKL